jgi:hypothetical protein
MLSYYVTLLNVACERMYSYDNYVHPAVIVHSFEVAFWN